jgi:hypothetical protein
MGTKDLGEGLCPVLNGSHLSGFPRQVLSGFAACFEGGLPEPAGIAIVVTVAVIGMFKKSAFLSES